jgi:4-amino-4-deoxy-L-arabinose transferase-like glycosyltransferase
LVTGHLARPEVLIEAVPLVTILVVAVAIRLLWITWLPVPPESDFRALINATRTIVAGGWPANSDTWASHGVGYPLLLAPVALVTDSLVPLRVENVLYQLGTIVVVWWLARTLFGRVAALAAAVCAAVLPGMWSLTAVFSKENAAMFFLPLLLWLLLRFDPPRRVVAAGGVAAALAMVRPAFISFLPVIGTVVVIAAVQRRRAGLVGWFGLGLAVVLGPIVALNLVNGGPPLPTRTAGWELWEVNNERASGGYFNPKGSSDDPFAGVSSSAELQRIYGKLGLQFIAANPVATLENTWKRHKLTWHTDSAGIIWSFRKADASLQHRVPLNWSELLHLTDRTYTVVLVLAVVGAVRGGDFPGVGTTLLVPLGWGVATLALVEANVRYHVPYDPLLCVLVGAAFTTPSSRGPGMSSRWQRAYRWVREIPGRARSHPREAAFVGVGVVGIVWAAATVGLRSRLAFWDWPGTAAMSWLILAVVTILTVRVVMASGPSLLRSLAATIGRHPRRAAAVVLAGCAVTVSATAVLIATANAELSDLAAVAPQGWQRYEESGGTTRKDLPLTFVDAGVPAHLHQVSYPDAVRLAFDAPPQAGAVVGLTRTLDDLNVGEHYRFYVQVYDPGTAGDPGERLTVAIDGKTVWERAPGATEKPGWRTVTGSFIAVRPKVAVRVERTAGSAPSTAEAGVPAVRRLHLYPKY